MPPSGVRKKAAEAAAQHLGPAIELVEDLAEASADLDALEADRHQLEERIVAAQRVFTDRYRAALGAWTDAQLTELGYHAERGGVAAPRRSRRRAHTAAAPDAAQSNGVDATSADADLTTSVAS